MSNAEVKMGVGALIISPDHQHFLTIKELETSRRTNKLKGMRSIPMESTEPKETLDQTLDRLFKEEVDIWPRSLRGELCRCELARGVVARIYLYEISPDTKISGGSHSTEVTDVGWTSIEDAFFAPFGLFRPGVYEALQSYLQIDASEKYNPHFYRYDELWNNIPRYLFDIAEGATQKRGLSRYGRSLRFSTASRVLNH